MGQKVRKNEARNTSGSREQQKPAHSNEGGNSANNNKLEQKLEQLENEWSYEKIVKVASAGFVLLSVFLSVKYRKKLEEFGDSVASMLGVESLDEFTPPAPLLEKFGIRRQNEIDKEAEKLLSRLA